MFFITLRPRQNGGNFLDNFKSISLNENVWTAIKIPLKFVPKGPINNLPTLVQIMVRRRSEDKPLSEPMTVNSWRIYAYNIPTWLNNYIHIKCGMWLTSILQLKRWLRNTSVVVMAWMRIYISRTIINVITYADHNNSWSLVVKRILVKKHSKYINVVIHSMTLATSFCCGSRDIQVSFRGLPPLNKCPQCHADKINISFIRMYKLYCWWSFTCIVSIYSASRRYSFSIHMIVLTTLFVI